MKKLSLVLFTLFSWVLVSWAKPVEISSPDGNIKGKFYLTDDSLLMWQVDYKGEHLILPSRLGITGYVAGLQMKDVKELTVDTTWIPVYGERSKVRDYYNSKIIRIARPRNRHELLLEIRAYNEGIAFRYVYDEHENGGRYLHITEEKTEFTLPENTKAWFAFRAQSKYELLPLKNWPDEGERPLTLELPNGKYACLLEAEVVNYARSKFVLSETKPNTVLCKQYDAVDEISPFATPWRVVMAADKPGQLLENNDIVLNLNPPCAIENTWWIRPGKVMRETTLSTKGAKELVDFAVKRNLQYIHFDAGWYGYEYIKGSDATTVTVDPRRNPKGDLDLKEAVDYAKKHGIGVFVYVNHRALYAQLDEILPLYKSWGIDGIKFGFVQVGSYRWTVWMHEAVMKCAKYGLLVDIHDEYRPTGFSRTYPNLLTQEGIYGNEEMPTATQNTIQPFTRYIAGAADYTVCYYVQKSILEAAGKKNARSIKTTSAHQMALSVICYSPLQFLYWYDKPSDSQDEPELEFFDSVPTVWDDTKVLDGKPGEFVSMARRSGDKWFVGIITNDEDREIRLDFDFLKPGKEYWAYLYYDDSKVKSRTKVGIKKIKITNQSIIDVKMKAAGGEAIMIEEI
ncbi:MAG: glycoside hydrolase family 97 catalytic domain-containing protein [Parabacteroides sp.]|nr:glycoside hydrolase family 97 catalytic domain-containing protein [Parabacteroides sp.]